MFPLAEFFPILTEKYSEIPEVQEGIVRIAWNYCVGEKIRKVSEPTRFEDGVLRVRVMHPQWKVALDGMKPEIISRVNKYVRKNLLKDVLLSL
jgi:predicted nucleic acid-binding Zn ribbon protein